jgi:hypothetical protein
VVDGSITAQGFASAVAGFEFDSQASVAAIGTIDALSDIIYSVSGQVSSSAQVTCSLYKFGEEWALVSDQPNTWTPIAAQNDNWTTISPGSNTWQ